MNPGTKSDLLIIENDPDNAALIKNFSRQSYVRLAGSVDQAIAAIQAKQPSLTFLNLNLRSDNDGLQLLQRSDNSGRSFIRGPVVIISGNSDPETRDKCLSGPTRVVAFLVKPHDLTPEQILKLTDRYLGATIKSNLL